MCGRSGCCSEKLKVMRFSCQALENYTLYCHNTSINILNHDGYLLDILHFETTIQSFHVTERRYHEERRLVAYVGLDNGMIYIIHPSNSSGSNSLIPQNHLPIKRKIRKLEMILQEQKNHSLECVHICTCNGAIKEFASSDEYVSAIIEPDKVLILRKFDHSNRYYSSVTSTSFHSMCFLCQKIKPEQYIVETLHIDLSFGVDDFLLVGNEVGELEYIRLIPDDHEFQSCSTLEKSTDICSILPLSPVPSVSSSPILAIFVDYPMSPSLSSTLPQISSNYRTPLLCLLNSDGCLLIYQPHDSKVPYLNRNFRISLLGSCIWKSPHLTSCDLPVLFWNGVIFSCTSGAIFSYYIKFNPLIQQYSISAPFLLTPTDTNFIISFSISPFRSSLGICNTPSKQFMTLYSSSQSIITLPLIPLLSHPAIESEMSTPSLGHPLLTQNEYHESCIHRFIRYFTFFILHWLQYGGNSLSNELSFPKSEGNSTGQVRDILQQISTSLAVENEVQSLIADIDHEIAQLMSFIEILQAIPSSYSMLPSERSLPGVTYSLSFDEYSHHDMTFLNFGDEKNIFSAVFSLQTPSELVVKSLQGKSIQLSWMEENHVHHGGKPYNISSWNHQISFQKRESTYLFSLVLPLPVHHLRTHYLQIDLIIISARTASLFQSSALNPHRHMKYDQDIPLCDMKEYHLLQRNRPQNPAVDAIHMNCARSSPIDVGSLISYSLAPIRCSISTLLHAVNGRINSVYIPEPIIPLMSSISASHAMTQLNSHTSSQNNESETSRLYSLIMDEIRKDELTSSTLPLDNRENRKFLSFSASVPVCMDDSRHSLHEIEEVYKAIEKMTLRVEDKPKYEFNESNTLEYSAKIISSIIDEGNLTTEKPTHSHRLTHKSSSRLLLALIHCELRNTMLDKLKSESPITTLSQQQDYERFEKDVYSLPRDMQQV